MTCILYGSRPRAHSFANFIFLSEQPKAAGQHDGNDDEEEHGEEDDSSDDDVGYLCSPSSCLVSLTRCLSCSLKSSWTVI